MTDNTTDAFAKAGAEQSFTQKALADYEVMRQRHEDGWIPPDFVKFGERAGAVIDDCIDRPVEEKEALKAFAILQFGAMFELDDTAHLATRYNEHLRKMADDQRQGLNTDDTHQIRMALDIVSLEQVMFEANDPANKDGFRNWFLDKDNREMRRDMIYIRKDDKQEILDDPRSAAHPRLLERYLGTAAAYQAALQFLLSENGRHTPKLRLQ